MRVMAGICGAMAVLCFFAPFGVLAYQLIEGIRPLISPSSASVPWILMVLFAYLARQWESEYHHQKLAERIERELEGRG